MPFLKHSVNGALVATFELKNDGDERVLDRVTNDGSCNSSVISIGRARDSDIVVEDPTVSQRHAEVSLIDGMWKVIDCGSTNGLSAKGVKVKSIELVDGDIFSLGTQDFEFSMAVHVRLDKTLEIKKSWIPGVYYTE